MGKRNVTVSQRNRKNQKWENLEQGLRMVQNNPLFSRMGGDIHITDSRLTGKNGAAVVYSDGLIYVNSEALLSPAQWAYTVAHCKLHLALGHFDGERMPLEERKPGLSGERGRQGSCDLKRWNLACDIFIGKFLADMKFGERSSRNPAELFPFSLTDERKIYDHLGEPGAEGLLQKALEQGYGTASPGNMDMRGLEHPLYYEPKKGEYNWFARQFAWGLRRAVSEAVGKAGGHEVQEGGGMTRSKRAAQWFINHYPLLGSLAASFQIIEEESICRQMEIRVAAVDASKGEIYVNPAAGLDEEELRFVLAHEFLHAGLGHQERCQGRDPELWNVACDFVINGWLVEMEIGKMPEIGGLYDENLKDQSAEEIYDSILRDLRKYSKLDTFRGYGKGDIFVDIQRGARFPGKDRGISLDDFYKRALAEGLDYHQKSGRGYVPAGLVEEIRALAMPPIPWDVELGQWFEAHFPELEKRRTYARPSRRQGATPDIPRPRCVDQDAFTAGKTFGVVVDTSGSMSTELLGMALGSIASYGAARGVPMVRVVFCDARAYDAGYMAPEEIAGRVEVKGRGGTILQPGIDLLEQAADFPKDGPILVITDGLIEDKLYLHREHAFLVPKGRRLPFRARGKVFYFS